MPVRKGDEVKIIRGGKKGSVGKITRVDTGSLKIFVEDVKKKKVSGQEVEIPIDPSNVIITKLFAEDKTRMKIVRRGKAAAEKEKAETKISKT